MSNVRRVSSVLTKAKDDTHDALTVQPPSLILLTLEPLVEDIAILVLIRMERKRSAHHGRGYGHVKRAPRPASIAGPIMGSSARQHKRLLTFRFKFERSAGTPSTYILVVERVFNDRSSFPRWYIFRDGP
jgi:hypothetical protein